MNIKNTETLIPVDTLGWTNIRKIKCGSWHVLALNECGDIYCWGWNKYGQLGIGNCSVLEFPTLLNLSDDLTNFVIDISCGSKHSAALLNNGNIYLWGNNEYFQISTQNIKLFQKPFIYKLKNQQSNLNKSFIECGYNSTIIKHIIN